MWSLRLALFPIVWGFLVAPANAQSVPPHVTVPAATIGFGSSVVVGGGEVVVGEPLNRTEGVVYVYRRDEAGAWAEVQHLRAGDHAPGDRFGRSLALDGGRLLVGATGAGDGAGTVYVFEKDASGRWIERARLIARGGAAGDGFGRAVALAGERAAVGAPGTADGRGLVVVFERTPSGEWVESTRLAPDVAGDPGLFGSAVALDGDRVAVGAPRRGDGAGAVVVFRQDPAEGWVREALLAPPDLGERASLGAALAVADGWLIAGAPGASRNQGAAYSFSLSETGWTSGEAVLSPDSSRLQRFGSAVALDGGGALIGAPAADRFRGAVHVFRRTAGGWRHESAVAGADVEGGDQFGGVVALGETVGAVGASGTDFGEGSAIVLERSGGTWGVAAEVWSEVEGLPAITGGELRCADGKAGIFGCAAVDVVSFLPREALEAPRGARLNDVWGWTDTLTGRRYALLGIMTHAAFVDVTDASRPVYLGKLPRTEGSPASTWRDIKVYRGHAFIVADGAGEHGMQVFDLTRLRDVREPPVTFAPDTTYREVHSVHNIVVNEATGFAYAVGSGGGGQACGGGLHMIDIRDPKRPRFAGCFAHEGTGRRQTGYTHDAQCVIYSGPDAEHRGKEICFGANETAISIADVTDKENPVALAQAAYPNVGYAHQGWLTEDHAYFYQNDELDELNGLVPNTRTLIWDVSDLDDPVLLREFFHETRSTDHNLYVAGRRVYQTNNTAGLRILDIGDPADPVLVGYFDPVPWGEDEPGFDGTWSSYPFFEDGLVLVSSRREGLFVVRHRPPEAIP